MRMQDGPPIARLCNCTALAGGSPNACAEENSRKSQTPEHDAEVYAYIKKEPYRSVDTVPSFESFENRIKPFREEREIV